MKFIVGTLESLNITDQELSDLLNQVFVGEGYTERSTAREIFSPQQVKNRGQIIASRSVEGNSFTGMVILVNSESPASKFAKDHEIEMHLLCVNNQYRGFGLGQLLVEAAIVEAINIGCPKMILWTQKTMKSAQKLYQHFGFSHNIHRDFSKNGKEFLFYEKCL